MKYATIVADPPWEYGRMGGGYAWREGAPSGVSGRPMLGYAELSVAEIESLPIPDISEADAHLYLWTTHRHIWSAGAIVKAWGFEPSSVLTWCKPPTGFSLGGTFGRASEFCIFARRGKLAAKTRTNRDWWEWSRGEHSAKPEAFLDIVESVSPGPYLELFARRNRMGWDTWGNQSLSHLELGV